MILKKCKKWIVAFLAIFAIINTYAIDAVSPQDRIKSALKSVFRSKPVRVIAAALVVGAVAYKPYRMIQHYLRTQSIDRLKQEAKLLPQESVVSGDNVVTKILFAHGLGGDSHDCRAFSGVFPQDAFNDYLNDDLANCHKKLVSFDFADVRWSPIPYSPSCLAQDAEIERLYKYYNLIGPRQKSKVAFYGLSRGASTIWNLLGTYNLQNVSCAVLESPFDDLETIVQDRLKYIGIGYIPGLRSLVSAYVTPLITCLPVISRHSVFGVYPKDVVSSIPKDIPLLFISSKQDGVIPEQSTQQLFDLLKESGHIKCHHIVCNTGEHTNVVLNKAHAQVREKVKAFIADPHNFLAAQASDTTII